MNKSNKKNWRANYCSVLSNQESLGSSATKEKHFARSPDDARTQGQNRSSQKQPEHTANVGDQSQDSVGLILCPVLNLTRWEVEVEVIQVDGAILDTNK